jgi:predicted dehydrogenase
MEKPFANRVSEADALLRVAEKNNVHIAVGHQYRTQRSAKLIKQLLDSGAIGTPIRVLWMWGEFRSESYFRRDPWRNTFQNAGGGVLMSQASHDLDLLCWMLGRPVQVSAMIGNHLHEVELEDIACANVLFENGTMGSFQFTYNHPRAYSVRQIQGDKGIIVMPEVESLTHDRDEEILVGTYESSLSTMVTELPGKDDQPDISWESCGFKQSQIVQPRAGIFKRALRHFGVLKRPTRSRPIAGPVNGFSVLMDSFIDAICHGGDPLVTGKSARSVIELINAMYLSAFKKKTVDLPLDPHEYDKLVEELAKGNARVPRIRAN